MATASTTTLIHGRLGDGEGDMSYLIAPGARAIYLDIAAPSAVAAGRSARRCVRLYRELKRARPAIVHTHMAKAGMLGRIAAGGLQPDARRARRARA